MTPVVAKLRRAALAAPAFLFLAAAGCGGGKIAVRGTVTLDDGTPLTRGLVVFERFEGGKAITARGEVLADGSFELATDKPGDGVPPGKYRVLVNAMDLSDVPDEQKKIPFDYKYQKFETSGLEFEVKSGNDVYPIKLDRPRKR